MALQKQSYSMNFGQGLDLKTDVNQVAPGRFLALENAVFQNGGGLQKRNGFGNLTTLANAAGKQLTTLNGNLLATGSVLQAYSKDTDQFLDQGSIQPINIRSQSLTRNSTSQANVDAAIASNGLVCTVYSDASVYYYQITDCATGQSVVGRTSLPSGATNTRAFTLGNQFIITYIVTITATPTLRYIAIPMTAPSSPAAAVTISAQVKATPTGYDGIVVNNNLFIAWNASDVGDAVRITKLSSTLVLSSSLALATAVADLMALTADLSTGVPTIWLSFYKSSTTTVYVAAVTSSLVQVLAPVISQTATVARLTNVANDGICSTFTEVSNTYTFSAVASNYITKNTMTIAGVAGTPSVIIRSVGLASKAFYDNDTAYMLTAHSSAFQPTYFIIDQTGNVYGKLSYSNGGGYLSSQVLPNVVTYNDNYYVAHQIKDMLVSANKAQGTDAPGGIYTQTGLNLVNFEINNSAQFSNEIAKTLQLTGGIVWMYDGIKPVEHSFLLWPEDMEVNTSTTGGLLTAQLYYYQFCYEWTDSQGNLHRSAPSLPVGITTTGATSSNTISVPTLRLTYKTGQNPVRIVGYRWSTAQPVYYQFTSITSPSLNVTTADSIDIVDISADSAIIGNSILYTTGGVVENIAAPAAAATTLYKSRQFVLDAENRNVIWYSKQVIQNTPVEFSDLFTIYVPPTTGAQGSTGDVTALSAMDDKLIIFKQAAIYYVTGNGPDNTGAYNDFSEATYITGTVGTIYPNSVVFMPQGIMFQSDKGIWLLGRDLSTKYIGADVEAYNDYEVVSALVIPGTNEVRFTLDSGVVLMYDYYYNQWGTFSNVPAISSTLYQGKHTYLNAYNEVRQETPGAYLDGSKPVLLSFKTAWLKLTGLQGYQRVYFLYLLSNYLTPYKLNVQLGFDYEPAISQSTLITPLNNYNVYGDQPIYGNGVYGGDTGIDQRRIFLQRQKCQSIQLTISEIFDSSHNVIAGAGLTMSGVNFIVGAKDNKPRLSAAQSAG
jgi:hypothetical protein